MSSISPICFTPKELISFTRTFNRVYAGEYDKELWKAIIENHEGTKDVANERYHVLIDRLNSFKQLDDENAESMYSRLNTLVNEINSLGVKQIEDLELIRKILHSLRRPDYNLVTTILYEKKSHHNDTKSSPQQGDRP